MNPPRTSQSKKKGLDCVFSTDLARKLFVIGSSREVSVGLYSFTYFVLPFCLGLSGEPREGEGKWLIWKRKSGLGLESVALERPAWDLNIRPTVTPPPSSLFLIDSSLPFPSLPSVDTSQTIV